MSLVLCMIYSCQESKEAKKGSAEKNTHETLESSNLPEIHLQKNQYETLESDRFRHAMGGEEIRERTRIRMKYDDTNLEIHFECLDNPRLAQNTITEDDRGLFKQEVFELYIAPGEEAPEHYLEIQINPNQALFLGRVTNRFKSDHYYHFEHIQARNSGIERKVTKHPEDNSWTGYLKIPLELIDPKSREQSVYRLNLFRIISNKDHFEKDWAGNPDTATYACWSSTMSERRPNFHHPAYFGYLYLQ